MSVIFVMHMVVSMIVPTARAIGMMVVMAVAVPSCRTKRHCGRAFQHFLNQIKFCHFLFFLY